MKKELNIRHGKFKKLIVKTVYIETKGMLLKVNQNQKKPYQIKNGVTKTENEPKEIRTKTTNPKKKVLQDNYNWNGLELIIT